MTNWLEALTLLREGDLEARDRIGRLVIATLQSLGAYSWRDSWEDVVQDVLLTLLQESPRSEEGVAVAAWISPGITVRTFSC